MLSGFASCTEDILGCHELSEDSTALDCHEKETGCLFDLESDACERYDVGEAFPEQREFMISRLEYYRQVSPPALIRKEARLDFAELDPETVCDSDFWCPYMSYDTVGFERELREQYLRLGLFEVRTGGAREDFVDMWHRRTDFVNWTLSILICVVPVAVLMLLCCIRWCLCRCERPRSDECSQLLP